jgi:hypothetical protein
VDELAPPLSLEEEVFLGSLAELGATVVGEEGMKVLDGGGGMGGLAALPRPDRVVAWLTSVNTEDVVSDEGGRGGREGGRGEMIIVCFPSFSDEPSLLA